jgi:hypothetical protein
MVKYAEMYLGAGHFFIIERGTDFGGIIGNDKAFDSGTPLGFSVCRIPGRNECAS